MLQCRALWAGAATPRERVTGQAQFVQTWQAMTVTHVLATLGTLVCLGLGVHMLLPARLQARLGAWAADRWLRLSTAWANTRVSRRRKRLERTAEAEAEGRHPPRQGAVARIGAQARWGLGGQCLPARQLQAGIRRRPAEPALRS